MLLAVPFAGILSLGSLGCKQEPEKPADEHPAGEHPTEEQPK
jgi:hypothetical protein